MDKNAATFECEKVKSGRILADANYNVEKVDFDCAKLPKSQKIERNCRICSKSLRIAENEQKCNVSRYYIAEIDCGN